MAGARPQIEMDKSKHSLAGQKDDDDDCDHWHSADLICRQLSWKLAATLTLETKAMTGTTATTTTTTFLILVFLSCNMIADDMNLHSLVLSECILVKTRIRFC